MARWDQILTLPIQNPPTLEFSSSDLTWSRIEGWKETMDRLALIPFSRVCDFLRGESNNKECPTRFHVEARRKRPTGTKLKVDGILEYILYWCSFGPDDHREGGSIRPSRIYTPKRKTPAGRPNTKRGCTCHFIVKRLVAQPEVALIVYNKDKHVDKNGLPCHGLTCEGSKAKFAPFISEELRVKVSGLLHVGVPVEVIMQRHSEMVEENGGVTNRDDLLTHRCVRRMERKIRRDTHELDLDDAVSVNMWVQNNQNNVFYYEDFSNSDTFTLGIQTDWQLQQMIRFGNKRLLASDSKFGTNKLKYPVYSLLVFDSENNAIPVAWVITPNYANNEIYKWIGSLYNRVRVKDPTWQLGGFIIDDPLADVVIIREILQCSVLINIWRVRHAWHKNIIKKCSKNETCVSILQKLGEILYQICTGDGNISLFEAFMQEFSYCSEFLEYFKATWFPKLGAWISALKSLPISTSAATAALETYHHLLKTRVLNETNSDLYQRTDWLVHKLGTKTLSYFWLDQFSDRESFSRYSTIEWKKDIFEIPIADVTIENNSGLVICEKNRDKIHVVKNIGMDFFAFCDCGWAKEGYICKHAVKVIRVYRERGLGVKSLSMACYERALKTVLDCVPVDNLVRDHAVGLMVRVRAQLVSLFEERERERGEREREERENEGERKDEFCERKVCTDLDADAVPMDVDSVSEKKYEVREEISQKVEGVCEKVRKEAGNSDETMREEISEKAGGVCEKGSRDQGNDLDEVSGMQILEQKDMEIV